jgi:hypothetical protein
MKREWYVCKYVRIVSSVHLKGCFWSMVRVHLRCCFEFAIRTAFGYRTDRTNDKPRNWNFHRIFSSLKAVLGEYLIFTSRRQFPTWQYPGVNVITNRVSKTKNIAIPTLSPCHLSPGNFYLNFIREEWIQFNLTLSLRYVHHITI